MWSRQVEVCNKLLRPPYKVLVRAGHSVGKSWLAARLSSWHYDSFPESYTILTAPTRRSVEDVLFAELRRHRKSDPNLLPRAPSLIESASHWIKGYTAGKGEAFSGRHLEHMMFHYDEATALNRSYWESGRSMFTGPNTPWMGWYNPIDVDSPVYEEESTGAWHVVTISQLEHPNVLAELRGEDPPFPGAVTLAQVIDNMDKWGERLRPDAPPQEDEVSLSPTLRWIPGPDAYSRVLGLWPKQGRRAVWSDALWRKMEACRWELNPAWRTWIGCDVAFYGDDETTMWVKTGPCIVHVERHHGWGPKRSTARLKELCEEFKGAADSPSQGNPKRIKCLIDAGGGYGSGIADYADGHDFELCYSVSPARNEEKFHNTRSELWFTPLEHVEHNLIDISRMRPDDKARLKAELTAPTYGPDTANRYLVEPKPDTMAKLGRSPDMADGFNLCVYAHDPRGG